MRKLYICICKDKDADQLCSECTADQRFSIRYLDSTIIPLLLKSEILSFFSFRLSLYRPLCVGAVGNWEGFQKVKVGLSNDQKIE